MNDAGRIEREVPPPVDGAEMPESWPTADAGAFASRYGDAEWIDSGSQGVVFDVFDRRLRRHVAMKVVRPTRPELGGNITSTRIADYEPPTGDADEEADYRQRVYRFIRESWLTARLQHPSVVPIYDAGVMPSGIPYYTMRLVNRARTLRKDLDRLESANVDERLALLDSFLKACDAVRFAHAENLLHRDLKPDNIVLGPYGEVFVIDWGLGRFREGNRSVAGELRASDVENRARFDAQTIEAGGTPGYMSPEAYGTIQEMDERGDVYSLAAILYHILVGHRPFHSVAGLKLFEKLRTKQPASPIDLDAAVPQALSDICDRGLSRDVEERPAGVEAFVAEIRAWRRETEQEREVSEMLQRAASILESVEGLEGEPLTAALQRVRALQSRILHLVPGDARAVTQAQELERLTRAAQVRHDERVRSTLRRRVAIVGLVAAAIVAGVLFHLLEQRRLERKQLHRERELQAQIVDLDTQYQDIQGYRESGRFDAMRQRCGALRVYYEELLETVRPLTFDELDLLTWCMNAVGDAALRTGDFDGAVESYRENLERRDDIFERFPDVRGAWGRKLLVVADLGTALRARGDLDEALRVFTDYRDFADRTVREGPQATQLPEAVSWLRHVGQADLRLGATTRLLGRAHEAGKLLESGVQRFEEISRRDPDLQQYAWPLGNLRRNRAWVRYEVGDLRGAREDSLMALQAYEVTAGKTPRETAYGRLAAEAAGESAGLLLALGDVEAARTAAAKGFAADWARLRERENRLRDVYEGLSLWDGSGPASRDLWGDASFARGLRMLAAAGTENQPFDAAQALDEAVRVGDLLKARAPNCVPWMVERAAALLERGIQGAAQGKTIAAAADLSAAYEQIQTLRARTPSMLLLRTYEADCVENLAVFSLTRGDATEALQLLERARALRDAQDPKTDTVNRKLARTRLLIDLGHVHMRTGDADSARKRSSAARALADTIETTDIAMAAAIAEERARADGKKPGEPAASPRWRRPHAWIVHLY